MLIRLLEEIDFPEATSKQKNSLIKKLSRSSDKDNDVLTDEVQKLLSVSINSVADSSHVQTKSGLLKNLFMPHDNTDDKSNNTISAVISSDTETASPLASDSYICLVRRI